MNLYTRALALAVVCSSSGALGQSLETLYDQSPDLTTGFRSEYSTSPARLYRAAEDIYFPGGSGEWQLRSVAANIATNSINFTPIIEIYANVPNGEGGAPAFTPLLSVPGIVITDLAETVTIQSRVMRRFRLEATSVWPDAPLVTVPAGTRLWIAAGVRDTFSQNERCFVLGAALEPAQRHNGLQPKLRTPADPEQWLDAAPRSNLSLTVAATRVCTADFNQSGQATVQDLFDFLTAYYSGGMLGDFNRSGDSTVQDIFDFLAAFFVGCP